MSIKKKIINNPQNVFIIIGLIYGLSFLLLTPPFQVIDEGEHFDKALYLSEGGVLPILDRYPGYYVPHSVNELKTKFYASLKENHEKIKINEIYFLSLKPLNNNIKVFTDTVSSTAIITYSPIPYLASTFAIIIGKSLNFSPLVLLYFSRLANLFLWLFFIYMAIRLIPIHKWVLLMLALMPMAIFQGASLSADSFTIALSFLVISVFLNFSLDYNKEKINIRDIGVLFVLLSMLALTKQTYLFLVFLFFIIPYKKLGNVKRFLLVFSSLFLFTFGISFIWSMFFKGFYIPNNISITNQTSLILSNPIIFCNALINSILTKDILFNVVISFVGNLGWGSITLPNWLVVFYTIVLILTALLDKNGMNINLFKKIIILSTLIIISLLICLSMYITGSSFAQSTISSIAGRYFIPISPLIFLIFYNNKINFEIKNGFNLVIIGSIIFSLIIALYLVLGSYYIIC